MEIETILQRAVWSALGGNPTPKRRRDVAEALRILAGEQDRLAEIQQRTGSMLPPNTPRSMGRRGRVAARWVRIERTFGRALWLHIGRAFWYELGRPRRLNIQLSGGKLILVVAEGNSGYSVVVKSGLMPKINAAGSRDLIDLEDGRYHGTVRGQTLELGDPL